MTAVPLIFPKRCACGRIWRREAWMTLEYVGIMDDGVDRIELRHCTCGSTISMLASVVARPPTEW